MRIFTALLSLLFGAALVVTPAVAPERALKAVEQVTKVDVLPEASAAACNYCLIIRNNFNTGSFYVVPDSELSCTQETRRLLHYGQTTRSQFGWADAGCFLIDQSYDAEVYDPQAGTTTWVCATGWKRLAEPPYPHSGYVKTVRMAVNSASHC